MATIEFDRSGGRQRAPAGISQHAAFPAIVATWFAVLLGGGSLIVPVAPSLGAIAGAALSVAIAVGGALAGATVARLVARAQVSSRSDADASFAAGGCRPLRLDEDLAGDGLASEPGLPRTPRPAHAIADTGERRESLLTAPMAASDGDGREEAFAFGALAHAMAREADPADADRAAPLPFAVPSLARATGTEALRHEVGSGEIPLLQLVRRLGASLEQHDRRAPGPPLGGGAAPPANVPDPARSPGMRGETDTALRAALAALRRANRAA